MRARRVLAWAAALAGLVSVGVSPGLADEWRRALESVPKLVRAAPAGAQALNRCWVPGALDRQAIGRVAIHAAPRAQARVLRRVPSSRREAGDRIAPEFMVLGSRDGWLLIRDVGFAGYDLPEQTLFAGAGWIEARYLRVMVEAPSLHRDPDPRSPEVARLIGSSPEDEAMLVAVHGCSGTMLDVTMRLAAGRSVRGWASGACANQVTTCGGGHRIAIETGGRLVPVGDVDDEAPPR